MYSKLNYYKTINPYNEFAGQMNMYLNPIKRMSSTIPIVAQVLLAFYQALMKEPDYSGTNMKPLRTALNSFMSSLFLYNNDLIAANVSSFYVSE
jgi:hypothetical protein